MGNIIAATIFSSLVILSVIGIKSVMIKYECDLKTGKICTIIAVPEKGE